MPAHEGDPDAPLQLQIASLDYSSYVGRIGVGRINQGTLKPAVDVAVCEGPDAAPRKARINQVLTFEGLERQQAERAGPGDIVLILGPGNIGQGSAMFARAAGAEVVIVGKDDEARLGSLRRMGFNDTVDLGDHPFADALAPYLAKGKFDAVIEATGAPPVVQQGLDVLKKRGIMVVVGIHPKPVTVNLTRLVREHQQIRGSYRAPLATWQRVVDFLGAHADLAREMISHRLPLDQAIEGLELSRSKGASKVMIVQ